MRLRRSQLRPPPPPPKAQAPSPPHPESPSPPSPTDPLLATLSAHFNTLIPLLREKLAQPTSIYEHSASTDRLLHHKIRKEMRKIARHPLFPDIENGMSDQNFYLVWGRLEVESARWGAGDLRRDRGRVWREQRAIEEVFGDWGLDVGRRRPRWVKEKEEGGMGRFLRKLGVRSRR